MKYLLVIILLFSGLFAHGTGGENHLHFFSSWHVESFTLLVVILIAGLSFFKYFTKESS